MVFFMEKMSGQPGRQFFRRPLYRLKPRQESGETAFLFLFSDYFASSAKKQGGAHDSSCLWRMRGKL
ncbi:hypothetical protein DXC51_26960 [Eisenbergiella massiliensis]|uniref:Uncharacterized protein n=1 Tax=Eisenbergiella massiliensis TaxID=1720294 RepID=A0A3E3HVN2_9FIRM|nr:hypothetical protein DXC51_26960 [Eisenbergiella massiliensis]